VAFRQAKYSFVQALVTALQDCGTAALDNDDFKNFLADDFSASLNPRKYVEYLSIHTIGFLYRRR